MDTKTSASTGAYQGAGRRAGYLALRLIALLAAAIAAYLLGADPAMAQGDLGSAGETLLSDLSPWVLVGTVGAGILFAAKGRTSWAIVVVILGVMLWGITTDSQIVQGLSDVIWSPFRGGS